MTTAVKEEKKVGIKENVLEMATQIQDKICVDAKTGVAAVTTDIYEELLQQNGSSTEQQEKARKLDRDIIDATSYAFGQKAVQEMAKEKSLDHADLTLQMGKDRYMSARVNRKSTFPDRIHGGDPTVKYGHMVVSVEDKAGSGGKHVRTSICDLADSLLKD